MPDVAWNRWEFWSPVISTSLDVNLMALLKKKEKRSSDKEIKNDDRVRIFCVYPVNDIIGEKRREKIDLSSWNIVGLVIEKKGDIVDIPFTSDKNKEDAKSEIIVKFIFFFQTRNMKFVQNKLRKLSNFVINVLIFYKKWYSLKTLIKKWLIREFFI